MEALSQIPVYQLFGETDAFPDILHHERIRDRALGHDWQIQPHRHREMVQLFHMERGQALILVDGQEFTLKDGEFLYVPALAVHSLGFRQGAEGGVFSFPLTLVAGLTAATEELARRLRYPVKARVDPLLGHLLVAASEAFAQNGTLRAPLLAETGRAVLVAVAGAALRAAADDEPLALRRMGEFERLLRQNLAASVGPRDFAQRLGITPGQLNRICRAATGTSASFHIEAARMREASRLLAFTQLSIAEIGFRLGYDDPSYFSRRYRRLSGETPSAYRARFLS